ncbi:MAG: PAS domain-containing sensor histidine kinase [Candidatus Hodarchaeales archaeon]
MLPDKDLFFKAVEQSANMIIFTDKNGNIDYVNPKFEEITEYSLQEIKGKKTSIMKSGQMPEEIYKNLWDTIASGNIWVGELLNKTKSGKNFWVNMTINPVISENDVMHYVAIQEVITEKKFAEEILMEYKEQFKAVLQTNLDAIAILNEKGQLVQGNTALLHMFGYSVDELKKARNLPLMLISEDQHEKFITGWKIFARTGKGPSIGTISEWDGKRKDGKRINLELSISPIQKYREGEIKDWLVAIIRDITNRKIMDEKIKNQTQELSEFAHTMSHDLRSHLQNIQLQTFLMKDDISNFENYSNKIVKQTSDINELLTRSVKLADAGLVIQKEDKINIKEIINSITEITIPKEIVVNYSNNTEVNNYYINCDREKLLQILKNVFENTVKHSKPENINIKLRLKDDLIIDIENDGKTIPENIIAEYLFEKEKQKPRGKNGIGLAIIRKIIDAHEWDLILTNNPLTKYSIRIPKSDLELIQ